MTLYGYSKRYSKMAWHNERLPLIVNVNVLAYVTATTSVALKYKKFGYVAIFFKKNCPNLSTSVKWGRG